MYDDPFFKIKWVFHVAYGADLKVGGMEGDAALPFVHVELHTQDPDRAMKFYAKLFDWTFEDMPEMNYAVIKVGEGTGGGIIKSPMSDALPQWVPYVLVDDITASTDRASSLGATVTLNVTEIPGIGRFSMCLDPTGAAFALFQPAMPA